MSTALQADEVVVGGKAEGTHDKSIITLLETARANNITFNCYKFVFKSKDLKLFDGNLTPEEYKGDSKKLQAITEMKLPQNLLDLQSYLGLVNYLNHFSRAGSTTDSIQQLMPQKVHSKHHFQQFSRRSQMHLS